MKKTWKVIRIITLPDGNEEWLGGIGSTLETAILDLEHSARSNNEIIPIPVIPPARPINAWVGW